MSKKTIEQIRPVNSLVGFYDSQIEKLQEEIESCEKESELIELNIKFDDIKLFDNSYITDTAGFEPLDVKFKKFEQNGIIAQLHSSDFDSASLREMFLSDNMQVYPDDDIEDVYSKLALQRDFANRIHQDKLRTLSAKDEEQSDEEKSGESTKSDVLSKD